MSAKDELYAALTQGVKHAQLRQHHVDTHRAEVLREAIEAARSEYLHDDTGTAEDEAYNRGVSDAVAAIGVLLESTTE